MTDELKIDWMAEAAKADLTPMEVAVDKIYESRASTNESFFKLLKTFRQAIDEFKQTGAETDD